MRKKYSHDEIYRRMKNLSNIELIGQYTKSNQKHKMKCHCGKIFISIPSAVLCGHTSSCGCTKYDSKNRLGKDKAGQQYGTLKVLYRSSEYKSKWVCQCKCGKVLTVTLSARRKSCGCLAYKGCKELSATFWGSIRNGAKSRNLIFSVTIQEAWDLFLKQNRKCALSGIVLTLEQRTNKLNQQTASFDRIDSKKGYITGNVQWVHKDINRMKMDLQEDKFINLCNQISQYQKTKSLSMDSKNDSA